MILAEINKKQDKLFTYIDNVHNDIRDIKVQTTKTNGRVTHLEHLQKTCPVYKLMDETEKMRVLSKNPELDKSYRIGRLIIDVLILVAGAVSVLTLTGAI